MKTHVKFCARSLTLGVLVQVLLSTSLFGQTLTDSTRPVVSPDGKKSIVVDRIFRVIDGEPERYPSRMVVRISDLGSTTTRQRRLEASQVRLLNPPRWLDTQWAAFTYNISKNANGVVYVNSDTGEALQMEFVALRRRMAATDVVEVELTSFEVTEYANRITRVSNITRRNRSVFPLFLRPLPPYDTSPFPWVFADQVRAALQAYHNFLTKHGIHTLRLEQASESFAPEDKMLAALACADGRPIALLSPMEAESPAAALERVNLFPLDADVTLNCLAESGSPPGDVPTSSTISEDGESLGHFGELAFRTSWKNEQTALVEQEVFESEEGEPHREPLYALHIDGKIEKLGSPKKPTDAETTATAGMDEQSTWEEGPALPNSSDDTTATAKELSTSTTAAITELAPKPTPQAPPATTEKARPTQGGSSKKATSRERTPSLTKKASPTPSPSRKSSTKRSSR
ncbi:MAG: hypothetical protein N2Z21_07870 [Candidatus Sumerlaeaceae bacterium]|nr:hypothetical protein [Candidatus Sumerlaeaceae bacterium]